MMKPPSMPAISCIAMWEVVEVGVPVWWMSNS